jgi:hypothetical protein
MKINEPIVKSYSKHAVMIDVYFKQLPRSYLYDGYTTLVDLTTLYP